LETDLILISLWIDKNGALFSLSQLNLGR